MPILGLMTKGEVNRLVDEAIKKANKKNPQYPGWALQTADSQSYIVPDLSIYGNQADLYRRLSWVLTAIDLVAQATTMVGFSVKERSKGEKLTEIENHPFELLLQKPNPVDSRHELLYATVAMWKLTGNGYWWLNKANEKAPPDEIWHIPSHMIYPVPDGKMYIKGYRYLVEDGREVWLEPWEIVHFRRFNPYNRFLGLSAIESLATVATGDLGMQDWNTKLFKENNARLPGIITFEQFISDPDWEKIKQETRDKAAKRDIMMLRGVGQGGVNWLQSGVSQKDMEFLAGRQFNKEEIFSVLAPGAASILAINATEANAKTGRATLMEYGVYSMLVVMQEKITAQILSSYGENLIGEFDDPRIFDKSVELEEIATFSLTHTVAEVRDKYYNDDPLGDERDDLFPAQVSAPMMPFGQAPGMEGEQSVDEFGNPTDVNPDEEEIEFVYEDEKPEEKPEVNVKALVELDKWEAKCIKAGKLVTWHPVDLPDEIHNELKDMGEFSIGAFSDARAQIKSGQQIVVVHEAPGAKPELELVLDKLDDAILAYKAGYRPDQSRGFGGKWVDEGKGRKPKERQPKAQAPNTQQTARQKNSSAQAGQGHSTAGEAQSMSRQKYTKALEFTKKTGREYGMILDSKGNILLEVEGTETSVNMGDIKDLMEHDLIDFHTHPNESGFSFQDLQTLVSNPRLKSCELINSAGEHWVATKMEGFTNRNMLSILTYNFKKNFWGTKKISELKSKYLSLPSGSDKTEVEKLVTEEYNNFVIDLLWDLGNVKVEMVEEK